MTWISDAQTEDEIIFERSFNIYSMYDQKVNLSDRIHTFEANGAKKVAELAQKNGGGSTGRSALTSSKQQAAAVCTVDQNVPVLIK